MKRSNWIGSSMHSECFMCSHIRYDYYWRLKRWIRTGTILIAQCMLVVSYIVMFVTRIVSYCHCFFNLMMPDEDMRRWYCCAGKVITTFRSNKVALKNIKNHDDVHIHEYGRSQTSTQNATRCHANGKSKDFRQTLCEHVKLSPTQGSASKLTKHLVNVYTVTLCKSI